VEAEAEAEAEAVAPKNMPLPLYFKVAAQILADFCQLEVISFRFSLMLTQIICKLSPFSKNNDAKYYIINCKTTFQKEKQNWKQFRKRKRLLSAGSGSAGSGIRSA
jgi:hypothetical protein